MLKISIYLLVLLAPFYVFGEGRANHFKVELVRVDRSGKGYVKFDQALANSPSDCGSSHNKHLSFNTNTPGGQAILSVALAAHATDKKVQAYGTDGCSEYGTVESWEWGFIVN